MHLFSETGQHGKFFAGLSKLLPFLGNQHLRNFASWAGNAVSGWAVSDIAICLLASLAIFHVAGPGGQRAIRVDNDYFKGAGKVNLAKGELVIGVTIPLSTEVTRLFFLTDS